MAKKTTSKNNGNGTTHQQTFSLHSPGAIRVLLVGDFTRWQEKPIALHKDPDGIWKTRIELSPGTHQYRFLVDGEWCDDPGCAEREPNPFGSHNMKREVV
jgi:1,4-alpha-glucan branching enzyme